MPDLFLIIARYTNIVNVKSHLRYTSEQIYATVLYACFFSPSVAPLFRRTMSHVLCSCHCLCCVLHLASLVAERMAQPKTGGLSFMPDQKPGGMVGDLPPFKVRKVGDIVKIRPGPAQSFICLSKRPFGLATHFVDGRTVACLEQLGNCPVNHAARPPVWQGWLAVVNARGDGKTMFLSLTPRAMEDSIDLSNPKKNLRGSVLTCWRMGSTANSTLSAAVVQPLFKPNLRPEPDMKKWLSHLFQLPVESIADAPEPGDCCDLADLAEKPAGVEDVKKMVAGLKGAKAKQSKKEMFDNLKGGQL